MAAPCIRFELCGPLELSGVEPGELGGWIETEGNLSQEDDCWVYPGSYVYENARVEDDCRIDGRSAITGRAKLNGFILCSGATTVCDDAVVTGVANLKATHIFGTARIACGEDGPSILPGSWINFDVAYGNEYAVCGVADEAGAMVANSKSGPLCVSGSLDRDCWSGNLSEFKLAPASNPTSS